MIKHVVLLNWKAGVTQAQIDRLSVEFHKLNNEIPEIQELEFGPDEGYFKGNSSYALVAEFANEADFKSYVAHPKHQAFLQEVSGPITESFHSAQFIL